MSVFGHLTTIVTILAGIVILDESFYYYHAIGTVFILVGCDWCQLFWKGKEKRSGF